MKCEQVSLPLEDTVCTIGNTGHGIPVIDTASNALIMKVKPTGFILNSSLVIDVLNRSDCFVINLHKGTMYSVPHDRKVEPVISKLLFTRD